MTCKKCGKWIPGTDCPSTLSPPCKCSEIAMDVTNEEHKVMIAIAEYQYVKMECGFSNDDIETRLIEIIHIATGGRTEFSR